MTGRAVTPDVRSPLWWAAFLLTLFLIGAVSWTWAGEVDR